MLTNVIHTLTRFTKWIALTTMALMMFFIAISVISRAFYRPILGDVELVQLGMVVLIMCGLAYTQHVNGHISIGIIIDKFNVKSQKIFDIIACILNVVVTFIIAYIFFGVAFNHKDHMPLSTNLLGIPFYPFDFVIVLGFFMWGLEAFLKLIHSILVFFIHLNRRKRGTDRCQ